jgi:MinD superfamily P-loop ATPase
VSEDTVQHLLTLTRAEFDITILDLSTPLDSELFSTANSLPRNVATISALKRCDLVISVLLETPLSLSRYLGQSLELQEINPQRKIVINRSTRQAAYSEVLRTLTKESIFATIPDDQPAFQLAESESLPLALARRKSAARTSVALIANKLLECPPLGN